MLLRSVVEALPPCSASGSCCLRLATIRASSLVELVVVFLARFASRAPVARFGLVRLMFGILWAFCPPFCRFARGGHCRRLMFENIFVLPHLFLCCFIRRFDDCPEPVLRFPAHSEWALLKTATLPDWRASVMSFVMIAYCDRPTHPYESVAVKIPCRL